MRVISDLPGKNNGDDGFGGGGRSTTELTALLEQARNHVVIQSPYLVLTDEANALFEKLIQRGVTIQVSTNFLASTDNLPTSGGYRAHRKSLLKMGLNIYEYKPHAENQKQLMHRAQVMNWLLT
ncbi:MAG TPA: hypothetical protein ENI80_05125 [Acidiferrobacteraceae bacterium]|nr:hypothetical protein [Acidiferrobacteraceae bacterium]